jgi:hypothetical protein
MTTTTDDKYAVGATANAEGTRVWVLGVNSATDSGMRVYVYDNNGAELGSWLADQGPGTKIRSPNGIATDGTDIWIVDGWGTRVKRYSNAASRVSGSQTPSSLFVTKDGGSGITTDGSTIWIVNYHTDLVYMYTAAGEFQGDWALHSTNTFPNGLTIDPSGVTDSLWVVDTDTDSVYEYHRDTGEFRGSFALDTVAGNTSPTGIADPPPPTVRKADAPLPAASLSEPEDYLPSPSRVFAINEGSVPWLSAVAWPNAGQPADDAMASDVAELVNWESREWLLAVDTTHQIVKSNSNREAFAARLLKDIADEKTELLDEDLLDLIMGSQP